MKRFFIPFLLMAAAAVAACQIKAAVEEPTQGSYVFTLKATSPGLDTKTDYSSTGKFSWSASDQISVLFHKGEENKFFTLTNTSGAGASADFSGTIDEGYEIGGTDGNKWALYPAGSHSVRFAESDGVKYPLSFNIPAVTDYSASSFSANIPMYALGDGSDLFSFQYLCSAYKFTFSDIASNISKVKFVVQNQTTYRLSGDVKLRNDGGTYLDQAWADGVDKTLTYISNVSDGDAVFYVPVRYYAACFQPVISLYNAENDDLIYTKTAATAKGIASKGHIQPINISVSGAVVVPWSFESDHGIDWTTVTASATGRSDAPYNSIKVIKATGDATNLYVYFEVVEDALYDDNYMYANISHLYLGDSNSTTAYSWQWTGNYSVLIESWIKYNNSPNFMNWKSYISHKVMDHLGILYYEVAINRADVACLQGTSATVALEINQKYQIDDSHSREGSSTQIGFAPTTWGPALSVTLPTYVAP